MTDPVITLWTAQQSDARALSRDALVRRSRLLRRRVLRRDLTEYAAGLLVMLAFGWIGIAAPVWSMRIACAATVAGVCVVMWNLWRRRPKDDPAALARDAHGYLRNQLVAQRDMLASVGRWYLGPLVPGMMLFFMASTLVHAQTKPLAVALAIGALCMGFAALIFWGVFVLNRRGAQMLDQQIAALDAERDPVQPE